MELILLILSNTGIQYNDQTSKSNAHAYLCTFFFGVGLEKAGNLYLYEVRELHYTHNNMLHVYYIELKKCFNIKISSNCRVVFCH